MNHVVVRLQRHGYFLDASEYEAILPDLASSLPPGARRFALDPHHYDYYSDRCVHDLEFQSLTLDDASGSARLLFGPNSFKHETGLTLVYAGLESISIDRNADHAGGGTLGSLLLDELRPASRGLAHEFALTCGLLARHGTRRRSGVGRRERRADERCGDDGHGPGSSEAVEKRDIGRRVDRGRSRRALRSPPAACASASLR